MPRAPHQPRSLLDEPFRGSVAVRCGLLTPDALRSRAWRRLFRDVYVHRDVPVTHALRARAAGSLLLPGAVITGCSAAALWGVDVADLDDDVELTLPPGGHPVRVCGLRVRRARLDESDVMGRGTLRFTSPEATVLRIAATLPLDDAVVAVDRFLRRGVALDPLRARAAAARGAGSARSRAVCALADGLAESPQETRLRLLMWRGGIPTPVAQFVVRVNGRFIARVDFAWPERKVAVEYDGAWHGEPGQFARDRRRLNELQAAGWRIVFVTAADLHRPAALIARIIAALAA